jgi:hypothetical protein
MKIAVIQGLLMLFIGLAITSAVAGHVAVVKLGMQRSKCWKYVLKIGLLSCLGVAASAASVEAQGRENLSRFNAKAALGIHGHDDGRLVTGYFEFRLLPRFSIEPNVGVTHYRVYDFAFAPSQRVDITKFSMGVDGKVRFLFNKRYPFEGIHTAVHGSFFRYSAWAHGGSYKPLRAYHSKAGLGIGGNYYFFRRFSLGGTFYMCYSKGADVLTNPDGTTRRIQRRSGFILISAFQIGITF